MMVIIVNDPEKGIVSDNLIPHNGNGKPCQHLKEDKKGEYFCAIHNKSWYKETPCFLHGQIEKNSNDVCRMGQYILNGEKDVN